MFFSRLNKKTLLDKHDGLAHAFTSGGVRFYQYQDDFSMPADRALSAMDIYEEVNQRIDREYLESYLTTLELLLNNGKLVDAANLTRLAKERMNHIANGQLLMKLATVVYIAEWENPTRYSLEDADKKIAHWQKHDDVQRFFLRQPIAKYIPSFESANTNTLQYLKVQALEVQKHLAYHLSLLSEPNAPKDLKASLTSQLEQANQFIQWLQ